MTTPRANSLVYLACPAVWVCSAGLRHVILSLVVALVSLIGAAPTGYSQCCWQLCTFTGQAAEDMFGYSVSGAGDVNNDGFHEVIVGAPLNDFGGSGAGQAYVYSCEQNPPLVWTFTGETAGDWFGYSVSGAGDVNGDGYVDVIVGAPFNDAGGTSAGRAYVYSVKGHRLLYCITGEAAGDLFGSSVSGAGDVNDDGWDDVIVGAPDNDAGGSNAGRAYVFFGGTGLFPVYIAAQDAQFIFTGQAAEDRFGWSVSGAGDVNSNADDNDDLIVGAPYNSAGGYLAGQAYVYSGEDGSRLCTFTGQASEDLLGFSVSGAGHVNNDGYDDLIVGAPLNDNAGGTNAGRAYVYSGDGFGQLLTFTGQAAEDRFGWSVSGAGDANGDGYDDLIVGAPYNGAGGFVAGRAYVYSGWDGALLCTLTGEAAGDWFGNSVSGAGDVNSDGHDDLIVGAPYNSAGGTYAGRAYVYSGPTRTLAGTFTGEEAGDQFGCSVSGAGDVNDDGYDDLIVGAPLNDALDTDAGRAYVYSGHTGGLLHWFNGHGEWNWLGCSVSGAGDVNNDGFDDLIVGEYWNYAGEAYVFSGENGDLLYWFTGEADGDWFGYSVSGAGDVNNDGFDDVIVGAVSFRTGFSMPGRAYVFHGGDGPFPIHKRALDAWFGYIAQAHGSRFGCSVSGAGDVNNDGYDDLIVGAPNDEATGTNPGRAYVFPGGPLPTWIRTEDARLIFTGKADGDEFGNSVSGTGDVNNDGHNDLIVGAPRYDDGVDTDAGRAYVFLGGPGSFPVHVAAEDAHRIFTGQAAGDRFGSSVSGAGDIDRDGRDDLIVGAPKYDNAAITDAGRAYVISGGSTPYVLCFFTGEAAYDEFGGSVSGAGNVCNDGCRYVIVGAPWNDAGGNNAGRAYVYACCGPGAEPCGDVSDLKLRDDGIIDLGDVVYLINYLFKGGNPPDPLCSGDVNCDELVDIGDAIHLINYLYKHAEPPCLYCCLERARGLAELGTR